MKYCSKCKQIKAYTDFSKSKSQYDGLQSYCKSCHYLSVRNSQLKHPETRKRNRFSRRDKELASNRKYKKENKSLIASINAKRDAAQQNAVPKWANNFFIKEIYHLAALRTKIMGFKWHVDHIRPCALFDHQDERQFLECWSLGNLQPLWASENCRKGVAYGSPQ